MTKRNIVNILDLIDSDEDGALKVALSYFRCSKNKDVEKFLHENAIDFAIQKKSITYIVFDDESAYILGYFTLTHKSIEIPITEKKYSKNTIKRLSKFAQQNNEGTAWSASAFLIAQFAKNENIPENIEFSGAELMDDAFDVLFDVQHKIGGGIVYLDAIEEPHLKEFYENTVHYFEFGRRYSSKLNKELVQYMRFLK